ncbi:MAG: YgiT-type zinc finger protein [Candidatus Margulisiibacteriota bacterium]
MTQNDQKKKDDDLEKYRSLLGEEPEACEACGGPLELEKVNLEDYQGGKLYMMESVPAYVCQECGEVWVPEPLMAEFEKMIATAKDKNKDKNKIKKARKK